MIIQGSKFIQIILLSILFVLLPVPITAQPLPPVGKIISLQGRVDIALSGTKIWNPAHLFQELVVGDKVKAGPYSRAAILLADETQIKLNADSMLEILEVAESTGLVVKAAATLSKAMERTLLNLSLGEIWLRAKYKPERVKILTPAVSAAIRGSELGLQVKGDGESVMTIVEGLVEYYNDYGSVMVKAGERGIARKGEAPSKTAIVNPEDAVQWSLYYPGIISYRDHPLVTLDIAKLQHLLSQAQRVVKAAPTEIKARAFLGDIYHDLGNRTQAEKEYLIAITLDPYSPQAHLGLGWLYLEENKIEQAATEFQQVKPLLPLSIIGLSLAYYQQNAFIESLTIVEQGLKDSPLSAPLLVQHAFLQMVSGDIPRALTALKKAIEIDPTHSYAYSLLSQIYLIQNKKREAADLAQRAITTNPYSPIAYLSKSLVSQAYFELDGAIEAVNMALKLDPKNVHALINLAQLLFGSDKTKEALEVIRKALTLAPNDSQANTLYGFILLSQSEAIEAKPFFQKAIQIDSTQGQPHLGLGLAYIMQGEVEEGIGEILIATALEPKVSIYYSYLGKAYYLQRRFDLAFIALEQAKKLDPHDPTPYLYSGIFLEDLNRPGETIKELRKSVELNDNRAVYRSRFLLDRDKATKNVNLASAYERLNLAAWATDQAILSTQIDPANSAAHLFLGSAFGKLRDRTQAYGSEILLTRLLMPVNTNSFSSFNDYTSLFEIPRLEWFINNLQGSFDTHNSSSRLTGGTSRMAMGQLVSYGSTDGFRRRNDDERDRQSITFFKYALSPKHNLLLTLQHLGAEEGDHGFELISEDNDPNERNRYRVTTGEIGLHSHFGPNSDFLLLLAGMGREFDKRDPDYFYLLRDIPGLMDIPVYERRLMNSPYFKLQSEYLWKVGRHYLISGIDYLDGSFTNDRRRVVYFPALDETIVTDLDKIKVAQDFFSYYLHDNWKIHPSILLTLALRYDRLRDGWPFAEKTLRSSHLSPQLGLSYLLSSATTLRLAAIKAVQTHSEASISPTHIAGFLLSQNEMTSTRSLGYYLDLDHQLDVQTFLRLSFSRKRRKIPFFEYDTEGNLFRSHLVGRFWDGGFTLNRLLTNRLALITDYHYLRSGDNIGKREDHQLEVGLSYVHPKGWSWHLTQTYLAQKAGHYGEPMHDDFFITNMAFSYEFPGKWGFINFEISNLFKQGFKLVKNPLFFDPWIPDRKISLEFKIYF